MTEPVVGENSAKPELPSEAPAPPGSVVEEAMPTGRLERREAFIAFLVPFVLLLPFCTKAFHIDDTHFLRMAQYIQHHPLDYFGYRIHWNGYVGPGFDTNFNPPGDGYLLALAGALTGWNEAPLHIIFAAIAGLATLGIYRLARSFTARPLLAAAATALTPGFIVSSSTLMSDVPALALYVWSLHFWTSGVDEDRRGSMFAGSIMMGLCILTKYFGLTAVLLAAAYAVLRRRKPGAWCAFLAVPLVMLLLYSLHNEAL